MNSLPPIGSRYLRQIGLVIAEMNSRDDFGDSPEDYVIKRFWVRAEKNDIGDWELIGCIEIETVDIVDGQDRGVIHDNNSAEVYRIPFPYNRNIRKAMLLSFKEHPKFFLT